ncbi:AAA family ATPase, partial [Paenibacillus sp. GYB003]|uniref:AAA family ATPase n=1 Tax=Paenibacillus sp. GYB003 TaxID=2994392 RepID=UPI002F96547D
MRSDVPPPYPFCAVVGLEAAKKALLLHAVQPRLNGVLLCGEAGTAKTTLVRGLAELVPHRRLFRIPLHATEDRLLGGLDTGYAVRHGERRLSPGLLAEADGHTAALDDLNLMPESVLKTIAHAAEDGSFAVEREGLSGRRQSRFLLYGTMNPLEGMPAGAILDRFGLFVRVEAAKDARDRAEIVRRRLAFERDPDAFRREYDTATAELRERVEQASRLLPAVRASESAVRLCGEIAREAGCPGHRAELGLLRAALAIAAWEGGAEALPEHVQEAAGYVLPHR